MPGLLLRSRQRQCWRQSRTGAVRAMTGAHHGSRAGSDLLARWRCAARARCSRSAWGLALVLLAHAAGCTSSSSDKLSEREIQTDCCWRQRRSWYCRILPDHAVDPYGVVNPRVIWTLAVVVMLINAAGYVALRTLGPRPGPCAFRTRRRLRLQHGDDRRRWVPQQSRAALSRPATAGAVLSSVATDCGARDRDLRDQSGTPRPAVAGIAGCRSGRAALRRGLHDSRRQEHESRESLLWTGVRVSHRPHFRGRRHR